MTNQNSFTGGFQMAIVIDEIATCELGLEFPAGEAGTLGSSWTYFQELCFRSTERYALARTTCERYSAPDTNLEPYLVLARGDIMWHKRECNGSTRATENGM